ncbi:MAG: PINc/VapC family ATPase [Candidatus Aenigmarchaeota archaeon]|nr:PINc/VapC family ATPase [Candidatus Aenigmarchaeota archaeon]MDI6722647.1 PINc/VapC family ATPase [Candidatus Aenigmarchaeota archaeon]
MEKIVPDTSVLISGILTEMIEKKELQDTEIIIPEFVLEELRAQASKGREIGFRGLEEIKRLRSMEDDKIKIVRTGRRQTMEEIQLAKYGRIDALILDVAKEENAVLFTSDYVQSTVAEAENVKTRYFPSYRKKSSTKLSEMLTPDTMSLHIKEGTIPTAKRGMPGNFSLAKISDEAITAEQVEEIIKDVMDAARYEEDSFIEVGGHAASVVQLGDMRIVIARPPFSDGIEMTVVRPIIKLSLDDYSIQEKLMERLEKKAEGILIAGPPGSGKSTFAAALAEFFEVKGRIVKTMESPRDLQVRKEITQYSKLRGSFENTADMLLLVRPDYTIFDEVRKTEEFMVFSDMRLAGIGMVGVVHATEPVDAVQRFISRIELGVVPHVVDTIIYIKNGKIEKTYFLDMVVRTPTGMKEADLARPIIEVRNFGDNTLEYEIYTYGEENVIVPVKGGKESAMGKLAKKYIMSEISRFDRTADVEILGDERVTVRVENDIIPRIIGKSGSTIKQLEERLGLRIEVLPKISTFGREMQFDIEETGAYIIFKFAEKYVGKIANFYAGDEYIFSATISKKGMIKINKQSEIGKDTIKAILRQDLKVFA